MRLFEISCMRRRGGESFSAEGTVRACTQALSSLFAAPSRRHSFLAIALPLLKELALRRSTSARFRLHFFFAPFQHNESKKQLGWDETF
jgi:hypothetical protein